MANKQIIVGVSGGVAAYKSAFLVSRLVQNGFVVQVVTTSSATEFVGHATFRALTGRQVVSDLFDPGFPLGAHIELARGFDLLCVAPATANFMAKAANGLADDLLSTLFLCFTGPVIMAPAMNCEMWAQPSVTRNVARLESDGVKLVGPDEGWLSCRVNGKGRMAEPEAIFEMIRDNTE